MIKKSPEKETFFIAILLEITSNVHKQSPFCVAYPHV